MTADDPDTPKLQRRLTRLGYSVDDPEGGYGPSTAAAVREFQRDRGLLADGLFGTVIDQELQKVFVLLIKPPPIHHRQTPIT